MALDPSILAVSVAAGAAVGVVGCFAVMRRMTLAADAISHIALPGIGFAIALHLHPVLGAAAMLLVGMVVVWVSRRRRGSPARRSSASCFPLLPPWAA